ncbi:hypothetical protein WOLCODRAFT_68498, partial [Wolfiporia cocos MD-104 SS10]
LAPDDLVRPHIERYVQMGLSYPAILKHLKGHFDTAQYGLSLRTLKARCRTWGIERARGQGHTLQSIAPAIERARERFPNQGMRDMRNTLRVEEGMEVSEKKINSYMHLHHAEEVESRRYTRGSMVRARFWTAGVNDMWTLDQHDKWRSYHLYLHVGLEPYSGYILWLKIWWTNRNPRLVASYYLDAVESVQGMPLITQSDRGTENNGVANAQTVMRHRLDPTLSNTLQHRWMGHKHNIKPEQFWSQLRKRWSPGFEKLLKIGVDTGLYDSEDYLDRMTFFYIFIPFLQAELDTFRFRYNTTTKRRDPNKVLPEGKPSLIFEEPNVYSAEDYRLVIDPALVSEVRQLYAPPDDPVFELVPPDFMRLADEIYTTMGSPAVSHNSAWVVYTELLTRLRAILDAGEAQHEVSTGPLEHTERSGFQGEPMPVLNYPPARGGAVIGDLSTLASAEDGYSSDGSADEQIVAPSFTGRSE